MPRRNRGEHTPEQVPKRVRRQRHAGGQGAAQGQQGCQVEAGAAQQRLPEEEVPEGVPGEAEGGSKGYSQFIHRPVQHL